MSVVEYLAPPLRCNPIQCPVTGKTGPNFSVYPKKREKPTKPVLIQAILTQPSSHSENVSQYKKKDRIYSTN